jgi:SAM-dependent methyltransferase
MDLDAAFGAIDIYLFDQLLRRRITERDRVFDAGCGGGRNPSTCCARIRRQGVDGDPDAIRDVRALGHARARAAGRPLSRRAHRAQFLPDGFATVVISSAVLHFARDDAEFDAMLAGAWRLLAPGGMWFCRLASTIGSNPACARPGPPAGVSPPTAPTATSSTKPS